MRNTPASNRKQACFLPRRVRVRRRESFNSFFRRRHDKNICQWHIFGADLGGYAAVAAIWILQHYQDARSRPQTPLAAKSSDFAPAYFIVLLLFSTMVL